MLNGMHMENADSEGRFTALRLQNLRCFEEVEIPLDPRVTVIIGENGAGKTTVAEAMASLSSGEDEGLRHFPLRHGKRTGHSAVFDTNRRTPAAIWRHGGKRPIHQRLPEARYLFAYGRYRRVYDPDAWDADGLEPSVSPAGLLDELAHAAFERRTTTLNRPDGRLLRDLSRYLVAVHAARSFDPGMEIIWERLQDSLPSLQQGLERIEMVRGETAYIPMIIRRGVRLGLNELSDGYQAVLVIIFDLILRYAYLFSTLQDPLAGVATVVIDEVELHLHVRWQRTVLRQLTTLFPRTQFIVTTHSPAVVQAAIDDGHTIIVLREQQGAVQALPLSARARNRLRYATIGSFKVPADWQEQVHKELPDPDAYTRKASAFESLPINDSHRRAGFTQYAPEVFPRSRGRPTFPAVWNSDKRVKKALQAWSHGKGAYCESGINACRSQQVEHFKPKSLFPSLAYDWGNYFLACNGCNGAKSDKWPETGEYVRPDQGRPETLFVFDDYGGVAALLTENDAQRTVDDFKLDRSGLCRERQVAIQYSLNMLRDVIGSGLPTEEKRRLAQRMVKRAEAPKVPYSQALGQNLRRFWHEHFPDVNLF